MNKAHDDKISFCAVSGSAKRPHQWFSPKFEQPQMRRTIFRVGIVCLTLCQIQRGQYPFSGRVPTELLKSSKTAFPSKDAIGGDGKSQDGY